MTKEEQIAVNIFEAGVNALYQTIDQNDGSCSNPKKYEELKQESIAYIKPLIDEIYGLSAKIDYLTKENTELKASKSEANDAVEFAEWIVRQAVHDFENGNNKWQLLDKRNLTSQQLYEIFNPPKKSD